MNKQQSTNREPEDNPIQSDEISRQAPYEKIVSQVVAKIKNEPFLFVIAIAALLIGFAVVAAGLGSSDLRFIVVIIAALAFAVIIGYYIQSVLQMQTNLPTVKQDNQGHLQTASEGQTSPAGGTQPSTHNREAAAPTGASKYDIDTRDATIGNIEDSAPVNRHIGRSGESVPDAARAAGSYSLEEQRAALEGELAQHNRNLNLLRKKKAVYALGEEPAHLLTQIGHEEKEIERIKSELARLA
jgi:hypothetical protein